MATSARTVAYFLEQAQAAGTMSARKMFGEYGIYCDGRFIAVICDDQLFLKPSEAARALLPAVAEASPYPGARPHLLLPADLWEDADQMAALLRATAAAMPAPRPKAPRPKTPRGA